MHLHQELRGLNKRQIDCQTATGAFAKMTSSQREKEAEKLKRQIVAKNAEIKAAGKKMEKDYMDAFKS